MKQLAYLALAIAMLAMAPFATAAFDLQITEIWQGNSGDPDMTEDWFEVTNFGDTAWTAATDGNLWFDDDSADETSADLMEGVAAIGPGESAIFVDGGNAGAVDFFVFWNPVASVSLLGSYNGSGLSSGGDAVSLFLDADLSGEVSAAELFTIVEHPSNENNGGQSYDVRLGEYSTVGNLNNAVSTLTSVDTVFEFEDGSTETRTEFGIGSPGQAPVPEPASIILAGAALLTLAITGKRR